MSDWLFQLLGIDPSTVPPGAETEFIFTNAHLLASWRAFAFIAVALLLVYGVFWLYRRELDSCPRGVRMFLGVVRVVVIVLLALVLLGPALSYSTRTEVRPYVLVMVDSSASMNTPDSYFDDTAAAPVAAALGQPVDEVRQAKPSRVAIVKQMLEKDDRAWLRDLLAKGDLMVMTFDERAATQDATTARLSTEAEDEAGADDGDGSGAEGQPAGDASATAADPLAAVVPEIKATGQGTNLAKALRDALRHVAGSPVAGVIVISDGQHTAGHDDPLAAADVALQQGVPVFTIGVGDSSRARNVRVVSVNAEPSVWRGDPFQLQAVVKHEGLDQASVTVELIEQSLPKEGGQGPRRTIASKQVALVAEGVDEGTRGAQQTVDFTHTPKVEGKFRYFVRVTPVPNEQRETDNEQGTPVTVRSEQARVLLIAGGPSWEYRFLTALLKRDKTINLSVWLQTMDTDMPQEGNTVIKSLPKSEADLFKYDTVILLDPDPLEFNETWVEALKTYLGRHGGGLLFQAGPKHSSRFLTGFRTRGLRDVLPVKMADLTAMDVQSLIKANAKQWPLAVVPATLDHPAMAFEPELRANQARWQTMPGIYWSFPALKEKPAASTLIEHSDPSLRRREGRRPLLVTGQYGPGRTLYMGFNSTWRWRRVGREQTYYSKFWVQAIRYLVDGRLLKGKRRGQLNTEGTQFVIGDDVRVTATLYDRNYRPLEAESIELLMKEPDGNERRFELKKKADGIGEYEQTIPATQVGLSELLIELEGDNPGQVLPISTQIQVKLPDIEQQQTVLNRGLLTEVADLTGGRYVEINQLAEIPGLITRPPDVRIRPGKPVELWDTDRLLILLLVLLTLEWALRKRYKLM